MYVITYPAAFLKYTIEYIYKPILVVFEPQVDNVLINTLPLELGPLPINPPLTS